MDAEVDRRTVLELDEETNELGLGLIHIDINAELSNLDDYVEAEDSLDNTSLDKEMSKEVDDDEGVHVINDHDEGIDLSTENVVGNMNDDLSTEQVIKSYNIDLSNEVDKELCKELKMVVEILAADKEVSTNIKVYIKHSGSNAFE